MICPRCNSVWDAISNDCPKCGLNIRTYGQSTPEAHPFVAATQQSGSQQKKPLKVKIFTAPLDEQVALPRTAPLQHNVRTDAVSRTVPLHANTQDSKVPPTASRHAHAGPAAEMRTAPLLNVPHTGGLSEGSLLFNRRYRLYERQGQQIWLNGAFESVWLAQDAQRGGALVRMCEFVLPDTHAVVRQSILRTATMAFHTISRHTHIPTLLDAFNDQGRSFFVFEHIEGESLLARMHRRGRPLPEQEVVECCLQITRVLEFLVQQSPPLVHGLIRPEYLLRSRADDHYMLVNFSVILAGGATHFVTGLPRLHLSSYTAPEFARGNIDVRADIYALLATAYFLVTGYTPTKNNGRIIPARHFNAAVTPQFEAILAKGLFSGMGLRPDVTQRYQHPSELRRDLLMMHIANNASEMEDAPRPEPAPHLETIRPAHHTLHGKNTQIVGAQFIAPSSPEQPPPAPQATQILLENHPMLQTLVSDVDLEETVFLLPQPEELPPLEESDDTQKTLLYLMSLLICIVIVITMGRGLW